MGLAGCMRAALWNSAMSELATASEEQPCGVDTCLTWEISVRFPTAGLPKTPMRKDLGSLSMA